MAVGHSDSISAVPWLVGYTFAVGSTSKDMVDLSMLR